MPASATQMTEKERNTNTMQLWKHQLKNKSNANMESPITILWNVSKPRPDDREALRAGSAHSKPENGHRCMFVNARTNKNKYNHSSKYRNTTGNARLRNVGKCHPGDKKEGVPHLLEN